MPDTSCGQCRRQRSVITHYEGRVRAMARRLNQPNARHREIRLADAIKAKADLARYREDYKQHLIDHDIEELEKLDDESSGAD